MNNVIVKNEQYGAVPPLVLVFDLVVCKTFIEMLPSLNVHTLNNIPVWCGSDLCDQIVTLVLATFLSELSIVVICME